MLKKEWSYTSSSTLDLRFTANAYLRPHKIVFLFLLGDSPASEFLCRRFGTVCSIFIYSAVWNTEGFETPAYKIQTPGNHPKERIQHSEHGESLKSGKVVLCELGIAISYVILVDLNLPLLSVAFL
jgi:hypothetical protein